MSFSIYSNRIDRLFYTADSAGLPSLNRARQRMAGVEFLEVLSMEDIPAEFLNQHTIFFTRPRGKVLGSCPGTKGHVCCNYLTLDVYLGCSLGCSYCIMKSYLNFSPLTVYGDPTEGIAAIRKTAELNKDRPIRVGSGEVGDSLLLDEYFGITGEIIEKLADLPNVSFEAKTKTHRIDHLLDISAKGNAVISFSMNPEVFSSQEDGFSASIADRIAAAQKVVAAGYKTAFHFDPMFRYENWKTEYEKTVKMLSVIPAESIAWISLGTIRFTPSLKSKIDDRPYLYDEFVQSRDGKFRYIQKRRVAVYKTVLSYINQHIGNVPVYLCMESASVWKQVFGSVPEKIESLRGIFERVRELGE